MGLYTVAAPSKLNHTHTEMRSQISYYHAGLSVALFLNPVFSKRELKKKTKKMIRIDFSRVQITGEIVLREPLQN